LEVSCGKHTLPMDRGFSDENVHHENIVAQFL
jgi:hypothetical protein